MNVHNQVRKGVSAAGNLLLFGTILLLLVGSAGYRRDGPTTAAVKYVQEVRASVDGGPFETVQLPHTFSHLAPCTPVTVKAVIEPKIDDGVFIKTAGATAYVYLDDILVFEFGKKENYPHYMLDPATEIHIVETYGNGTPTELRVEFFSPRSSDRLEVEPFMVGTSKEGILERSEKFGTPWIFAMMQVTVGLALILISLCIILIDKKGVLFLWLGLFSMSVGLWLFGSSNLSVTVFRGSTLLYLLHYVGLFSAAAPLLAFSRALVDFKNPTPVWILEMVHVFAAGAALMLQLLGLVSCTASARLFEYALPAELLTLTALTAAEYFQHRNDGAKWFLLPVGVLTISAILDCFSYPSSLETVFSPMFQLGSLIFLLIMGILAGVSVKDSIHLRNQQKELEFEKKLMEIRLNEQQSHSLLLAEHEQQLRQQRHDLRHQLTAIQELASSDNEKLQGYLMALMENIPAAPHTYCENQAVNAVVSHYAALCQKHGISFSARLTVPGESRHLSDGSLCAVFGNLLENAVEACGRMESGRKFIRLNSRLQYDMLSVTMDNSFNGEFREEKGRFRSSKREDFGIGLSSVQSIAQKTGGGATFQADGLVFLSSVLLNV